MIIFKNYLKIAKTMLPLIIMYTAIFLTITIININSTENNNSLDTSSVKIALINHDKNSQMIKNFEDYIKKEANYVELDEDEESLKDALFFRKVDYIMIVPENYTQDLLANKDVSIQTMQIPDSYLATYSQELMNQYLNTYEVYLRSHIDEQKIVKHVKNDLNNQAHVTIVKPQNDNGIVKLKYYYNFANYTLLAIIMTIISMVMVSFHEPMIQNRNSVSPLSYKRMNRELLMGHIVMAFAVWLLYIVLSIIIYQKDMLTMNGLFLIINSFVFTPSILALSFLITKLTNKREIISGACNVFALGSSFICGSFIPQNMLSPSVLNIAKCFPSYWLIKNNEMIVTLTQFDFSSCREIYINMLIIICFTIGIYFIIQIITRYQLKK